MQTRRDFLKLSAVMGVGAVTALYSSEIRRVFAQSAQQGNGKIHLIWLPLACDSGCTISMLQASNPDLIQAVETLNVSADFWITLMTPNYDLGWVSAGYTSEDISQVPLLNAAFGSAPLDILVVEGSPQLGTPNGASSGDYCIIANNSGYLLLQSLASKATYVVALGECASFGGIPAANGNVTGATSVSDALKRAGIATKNPIINMPGCPAHPDWTLLTLASLLQGFNPELDSLGRPTAFFSSYIHDNCPRRGAYDRGEMAKTFDDPTGCYWDLGRKGPITQAACAKTKWNSGLSFCTQGGPMCWGCMHPSFPDPPSSPFFLSVDDPRSFLGLTVDQFAEIVAGAAAIALAAHLTRKVVNSRSKEEKEKLPFEKESLNEDSKVDEHSN